LGQLREKELKLIFSVFHLSKARENSRSMTHLRFLLLLLWSTTLFSEKFKLAKTASLSKVNSVLEEERFFRDCISEVHNHCFKLCSLGKDMFLGESSNSLFWKSWDHLSTTIFGNTTLKKVSYTPCQDRCWQLAHENCTEWNWANGGTETFKLFGRWPMKRVGIFEGFCSAFLCLLSVILYSIYLIRYRNSLKSFHTISQGKYGFEGLFQVYYLFWIITFLCAALFHTKDTPLTERLDYYSAFAAIIYSVYTTYVRVLWITKRSLRLAFAAPFLIYLMYHIWYMQFVSFDYGYNMIMGSIFGAAHVLAWFTWCLFTRHP